MAVKIKKGKGFKCRLLIKLYTSDQLTKRGESEFRHNVPLSFVSVRLVFSYTFYVIAVTPVSADSSMLALYSLQCSTWAENGKNGLDFWMTFEGVLYWKVRHFDFREENFTCWNKTILNQAGNTNPCGHQTRKLSICIAHLWFSIGLTLLLLTSIHLTFRLKTICLISLCYTSYMKTEISKTVVQRKGNVAQKLEAKQKSSLYHCSICKKQTPIN